MDAGIVWESFLGSKAGQEEAGGAESGLLAERQTQPVSLNPERPHIFTEFLATPTNVSLHSTIKKTTKLSSHIAKAFLYLWEGKVSLKVR